MKHIIYLTTFAILLMIGCSKPSPAPAPEQIDGYIFFSHDVETKASLINDKADLKDKNIGVVGFKYPNTTDWATYVATTPAPTPNVFYDDNGSLAYTESVTCDESGNGTYAPLQGWANSKKYTFFAYYPADMPLYNTDGSNYTGGVPCIKYSLNEESLTKSSMMDVMTSTPHVGLHQGGNIALSFNHCLAALGVKVKNSSEGTIKVKSITWTLDGLKYKDVLIPLNGTTETKIPGSFSSSLSKIITTKQNVEFAPLAEDICPEKLLLIPQTESLTISFDITFIRKAISETNEISVSVPLDPTTLTTDLVKGKQHLIHLNFTDNKVEVNGSVTESEWAETYDVPSTFN